MAKQRGNGRKQSQSKITEGRIGKGQRAENKGSQQEQASPKMQLLEASNRAKLERELTNRNR